ncbi:MAG: heavy-metal-associated domain-containing protein [Alphaproteobacteria bacterium]|nr:heavy-metal-associated domain-containing protein [Alphaproteobacteria bacterium]
MKTYRVEGMTCGGCVSSVTRVVQAIDPALQVKVTLEGGRVEVEGPHSAEAVKQAVERAGYDFQGEVG